jgi:hypothetical protein
MSEEIYQVSLAGTQMSPPANRQFATKPLERIHMDFVRPQLGRQIVFVMDA